MLTPVLGAARLIRFIKTANILQSSAPQIQEQQKDTEQRLNHVSFLPRCLDTLHIQMTSEGSSVGICLIDITVFCLCLLCARLQYHLPPTMQADLSYFSIPCRVKVSTVLASLHWFCCAIGNAHGVFDI